MIRLWSSAWRGPQSLHACGTIRCSAALSRFQLRLSPKVGLPNQIVLCFGVGQGLTAGTSHWLGLRAWGYLICTQEGLGCCSYVTDGHRPLYRVWGGAVASWGPKSMANLLSSLAGYPLQGHLRGHQGFKSELNQGPDCLSQPTTPFSICHGSLSGVHRGVFCVSQGKSATQQPPRKRA